jgi:hypothetical protein
MKAIFISYNQVFNERVEYILDYLEIRGYTQWVDVKGAGTVDGSPHLGTHAWPETNNAILTFVEDGIVEKVLESVKRLDEVNKEIGIRAFTWDVGQVY